MAHIPPGVGRVRGCVSLRVRCHADLRRHRHNLHGIRRIVLTAVPLAIADPLIAAFVHRFEWLVSGQALIGTGCAPAFPVCTVFIARRYPMERYAAVSSLVLGRGGIGMLATGSPFAWLINVTSWRAELECWPLPRSRLGW